MRKTWPRRFKTGLLASCFTAWSLRALALPVSQEEKHPAKPSAGREVKLYIREYRVEGAHDLPRSAVEEAVYPYLGPGRTTDDVEQARSALEKAYKDQGFQAVSVQIPAQEAKGGIVILQVAEGVVERVRVKGSRYYSLKRIKQEAPSLTEGKVLNFNGVTRDIVALSQLPDRRVTPTLSAGAQPGTVDIDLIVKDTLPLHGSLELNNRYSADTTSLRLNGSLSYNNLWQLGHSLGISFQISPEDLDQVKVFSGYYLARVPEVNWLSLMLQGTKQDSNVSTLGGVAVAGRGEVVGARALVILPQGKDFYHSLSLGLDYKHFDQNVVLAGNQSVTPITYYPLSVSYQANWVGKGYSTDLSTAVNFHVRGLGSGPDAFDAKRFKADSSYIYFRGDLSHSHDLPAGFQVSAKVQGQAANQALVDSEEFSGGGLGTVRGYLESEVLGDDALLGSLELRTPSLSHWLGQWIDDWRFYAFAEGGVITLNDPLPEQQSHFDLASIGIGSRARLMNHLNGSLDLGLPLISQSRSKAGDLLLTFRASADF